MGLQHQLSDISSESYLISLVVVIAQSARYLHSLLFTILRTAGVLSPQQLDRPDGFEESSQSPRLTGFLFLCEQLNLNRICSYRNRITGLRFGPDCAVCLNRLNEGDNVRKLGCQHVFHKECIDGWLDQLNFTCPLCRAPLLTDGGRLPCQ